MVKAQEGVLIETRGGLIFYVRGHVHPPGRVIAFPRYIPDPSGDRERGGVRYRRVGSLAEQISAVVQNAPSYMAHDAVFDQDLPEVPVEDVARWYEPVSKLRGLLGSRRLDGLERLAVELARSLMDRAGLPSESMGVTGSILAGLHSRGSDIDLIVYGRRNRRAACDGLLSLFDDGTLRPYGTEDLRRIYAQRGSAIPFRAFCELERRKPFKGRFRRAEFFIRFVRDPSEAHGRYGDVLYKAVGTAELAATIADDSESMLMPSVYAVTDARILRGPDRPVKELLCFASEPLRRGEAVVARGRLESVQPKGSRGYHRLVVVGGKRSHFVCPILGSGLLARRAARRPSTFDRHAKFVHT